MSRYKFAPEVREDLKDIYRYIARDNPSAAGRLRQTFYERFRLLAKQPGLGQLREDLANDVRVFPVAKYVILYRTTDEGIEVIQVVHGARDLQAIFRG